PIRLAGDANAGVRPVLFEPGGDRDDRVVIAALPQRLTFALADPNHGVGLSVDAEFLTDRVHSREYVIDDVLPHDSHARTITHVIFVERAAEHDFDVLNGHHARREAANPTVAGLVLRVSDMPVGVHRRGAHVPALHAALNDSLVVLKREIFALLSFDVLVDAGHDRGHFAD